MPVVAAAMVAAFCSVFVVIIANVLTDFAYRFLDPKMRVGRR